MPKAKRAKKLSSARILSPYALVAGLGLGALGACHHSPLHESYGLRLHEMMAAQANAHPSHDAITRGEETSRVLQTYYGRFTSQNGMGGMGGSGGGTPQRSLVSSSNSSPMSTAGVSPLTR